ncbi:MAG: nitroreductase family protein [Candidatus Lokiarchaeota archaeon]|nr:nitroreductase family protein [Candidatus Lokiarchaeota archaeon]
MPIIGIDVEKCTRCRKCIKDCPTQNFSLGDNQEEIVYNSSRCILCGHCIAVCPENAILYKDMKDEPLDFKESQNPSTLVSYESLHPFLRVKRSVRQYQSTKLPKEILHKVINSMRYAPTGANMRYFKCLLISDDDKKNLLTDSIINALESRDTRETFQNMRTRGLDPIFFNAPHILIFYSKNPWDTRNVTIAMTYGMLSAQSLGLGSCWIGFAHGVLQDHPAIARKYTGIETYVLGVMTLGYPAIKYYCAPPRPRIEVKEL